MGPSPSSRLTVAKILGGCIVIAAFVLLAFLALLPTIVSTTWAKTLMVDYVNSQIPGKIEIAKLRLGWLGPQEVQGFTLKDAQGKEILSLQNASLQASLYTIIADPAAIGVLQLQALNAKLSADDQGNTNLEQALNQACCANPVKTLLPQPAITLKNVQASLNSSSNALPIALHIDGTTQQGALNGKFTIEVQLAGSLAAKFRQQAVDIDTLLQASDSELKLNVDIVNLPVVLLDQLLAYSQPQYSGVLLELLGPQLNVKIAPNDGVKDVNPQGFNLQFVANSANLSASAAAHLGHDFSLAQPAKLSLKLTPALIEKLSSGAHIHKPWLLAKNALLRLVVSQLQFPLEMPTSTGQKAQPFDLTKLALMAEVDLDQANFSGGTLDGRLAINNLHATLKTTSGSATAEAIIKGEAVHNGKPMLIDVQAALPKPAAWQQLLPTLMQQFSLQGQFSGLPLSSLDDLMNLDGLLLNALGTSANVSFSLKANDKNHRLELLWKSERLETSAMAFELTKQLRLQQPATITWQITPGLVNQALSAITTRLQADATAQLTLQNFSIPLPDFAGDNAAFSTELKKLVLSADLILSPIKLAGLPGIGMATLQDSSIHIVSASANTFNITAGAAISQPADATSFRDLLGENVKLTASALLRVDDANAASLDAFSLKMDSTLARLQLQGRLPNTSTVIITSPASISYMVTPAALKSLLKGLDLATDTYQLAHQSAVEFTLAPCTIPLKPEDISRLRMHGGLKVDDLSFSHQALAASALATIDNLNLEWEIDAALPRILLNVSANTQLDQQASGKISANAAVDNWLDKTAVDFSQATFHIGATTFKLPIKILHVLLGRHDLLPLIGDALNMRATADFTPVNRQGLFSINLQSGHIKANTALALSDNVLHLQEIPNQSEFIFELTPGGYDILRKWLDKDDVSDFVLTETATARLNIKSLKLPLPKDSFQPAFLNAAFDIDLLVDNLSGMNSKNQQKIFLTKMQSRLSSQNLAQMVKFDLHAKGQTEQGISTDWTFLGNLENGFTKEGGLNKHNLSLTLDADIDSLPISMLCQFVCVDSTVRRQIEAVIGTTLNAKLKAKLQQMNGPVFAELKGKNGHLTMDGNIANGIFKLNKDLQAQVTVTPQLSEYVLQDVIPIVNGMLNADQPLKLTVSHTDFALPLHEPSLSTVNISTATLDLGKVHFASQSSLAKVLSLLVSSKDQLSVWLTPLYFSITEGLVQIERVDMLINDNYPLAAWGKVDIGNDNVNMIIALSGASISRAFNVPGIPPGYLLQLPLRGTLSRADIDKTKAAARISALVAQAQGGTQGFVLGTVLHIAGGGLSESAPPAPTTKPLPWADMLEDENNDASASDGKKTSKNPSVEDIKKGASNLLKQLFK